MKSQKKVALMLCCIILMVSFMGCQARDSSIEYLIGVSLANQSEQWRLVLKDELEAEATKHKNVRLVFSDAAGSSEKQEEDIHRLMEYGIDLLIISPTDVDLLLQTICEVYSKLPVIVLDRAVEGYDYTLFIGPDNQLIGKQAGQTVLNLLQEKGKTECSVLELMARGYANQERSETFLQTMEAASIHTQQLLLENATRDCAEDALGNHPELLEGVDVIFAHNDYMAYGASLALEKLGYTDISVIGLDGFDGEDGGLALVQEGVIDATVTCPTGGKEAIQSALEILTNTSGVPKKIILRSHSINSDNVEQFISEQEKPIVEVSKKIRVGYVQIGENVGWRKASTNSIQEAANDFGIDLTIVYSEMSLESQINYVRQFVEQKMDVILISPVVAQGWQEVLLEARSAGIPVLLVDRMVSESEELYDSFIGSDFEEEGRRCARWMIGKTQTWQQVDIMELRGTEGASPSNNRRNGFESVIAEHSCYKIVYSESGNFSREGGKQVVQTYLKENNWDIDVIFSHNDDMALGAIEVLKENGIKPGEDVLVMSIDGTSDALAALRKGELNCVAECNPLLGPQLLKAVTDLMSGKELPLRIITDEIVFTRDTPSVYFSNRQY